MIMANIENDKVEIIDLFLLVKRGSVNECESYVHKFPGALEKQNKKRETVLHIAANNCDIVDLLLNKGADINATNYWGQTPLHYAAQTRSVKSIRRLLQDKQINATCKDANGYTALHYIFSTIETDDSTWKICLDCLVDAGIDINSTTNTGKSILHQISNLYNPLDVLFCFEKIFSKCQNVNLLSRDIEGRNFLHTWKRFKETELAIFDLIARCQNKDNVSKLLNQKDCSGSSPFIRIVLNPFTSIKVAHTLINSYGALLTSIDNMKNTALHVLSTRGDPISCQKIELIMKLGIEVNASNIFGQTALFLLNIDDAFDVFCKYNNQFSVEWDRRDRWNRTPFFESIYNVGTFVLQMLQQHQDYINGEDIFKSTPLHFAAYTGNYHYVKHLFHYTPSDKRAVLDQMGDSPANTAIRHGHFQCYNLLNKNDECQRYKTPICIKASTLRGIRDIREVLTDFPENMEAYFNKLLLTKHISNKEIAENTEDTEIISAVNKLVSRICDAVKRYDPRFEMSVFQTGSTADGTKVGPPNEFDFALCIKSLSENCYVETPANANNQFVCLRFHENLVSDYVSFSNENRYFVALPFLHYFYSYIKRALKEEQLWISGNFSMRPDEMIIVFAQKPVVNFNVHWNGSKYKKLRISIDLLPVVHKSGWWPTFISRRKTFADDVIKAGCFVTLHTKSNEFDKQWYTGDINDDINTTCKQQNECSEGEKADNLLLRVSVAPAEIALMQSLSEKLRKAYSLAKIMLIEDVCPRLILDGAPPNLNPYYDDSKRHQLVYNKHIKSYWLKNCTFYIAQEADCWENPLLDITRRIYEMLLEFATSCKLNAFLFPESDILASEKGQRKSKLKVRILLLERKVCIDMVLGFLGKKCPEDNGTWVQECEEHYKPFDEDLELTLSLS